MKILYVENDPLEMRIIKEILVSLGYEIYTASTCGEALLQTNTLSPEVVLINSSLPEIEIFENFFLFRSHPNFKGSTFLYVVPETLGQNPENDKENFFRCMTYGFIFCGPLSFYKEDFRENMKRMKENG